MDDIPENLPSNFLVELEKLKQEVRDIKKIQGLGESVAEEIQREIAEKLDVPHLRDKQDSLKLKLKRGHGARPLLQSEIAAAQAVSKSGREAARKLGVNYLTYRKYAKMYNMHTLLNPYNRGIKKDVDPEVGKYPLKELLDGKHPDYPVYRLKDKLIRSKRKDACCEMCGYRERRVTDGKIPLLLNFEDNDPKNHKMDNIKLLCYNCTFVAGKGFIKRGNKQFDPDVMQGSKDLFITRY
jgi:hypothetical protein